MISGQQVKHHKNQTILQSSFIWRFLVRHKIQIAIAALSLLVLILRRPDDILNPQLFAEDGKIWLQDAINNHYSPVTLFFSYAGYLAVFPRLVALLSGLLPFGVTPLLFNSIALVVETLPLIYLWSKRANRINIKFKIFITFFYLCMPFTDEIHGNITNSQWYLALVLFILVFIKTSPRQLVRWLERAIILVASLTGPFSVLISPILIYDSWRIKKIPLRYRIVFIGAFIQAVSIVLSLGDRPHEHIGFSVTLLMQIIGGQVFGAGLFGVKSITFFLSKPWISPVTSVLGIEFLVYVFIKSDRIVKYFITFAFTVFVVALISPNGVPNGVTWWQVLLVTGVGGRYYFILHTAIFLCLGWTLFTKTHINTLLKIAVVLVLLLSLLFGVKNDFVHPSYKNLHYQAYIKKYNELKPGQEIVIPINPGPPWEVELTKGK